MHNASMSSTACASFFRETHPTMSLISSLGTSRVPTHRTLSHLKSHSSHYFRQDFRFFHATRFHGILARRDAEIAEERNRSIAGENSIVAQRESSIQTHTEPETLAPVLDHEQHVLIRHTDMRIKQLALSNDPNVASEMNVALREAIETRSVSGKGLAFGLKCLKEQGKFEDAWEVASQAFETLPPQHLVHYMPTLSVTLLMVARQLGPEHSKEILRQLINPKSDNKLLWLSGLNSIRETRDSNSSLLFLKTFDAYKNELPLDESGVAVLVQYFTTFADMERSVEAFEQRVLNSQSPLHIAHTSPQFLVSFFHLLTHMGKRRRNRTFAKNKILQYFNALCRDETASNYVAPTADVLGSVMNAVSTGYDEEMTRDFFDDHVIPFLRQHQVDPEQSFPLILPLVNPWMRARNYKSVIWLYERHFQGNKKLCEWNTPLLNMLMQSYWEVKKPRKVIEIFDEFFASNRRQPTARTFNILLLAKCAEDKSFGLNDTMQTFKQFTASLPTTPTPPVDYNAQLWAKKVAVRDSMEQVPKPGDVVDTSKMGKIPPAIIKTIITSLLERQNVDSAIHFFTTYCQDLNARHFVIPPYRSIREIAEAILDVQHNAEKALTFLERVRLDDRFAPPQQLMQCLDRIEDDAESTLDPNRVDAVRERFLQIGAKPTRLLGGGFTENAQNSASDPTNEEPEESFTPEQDRFYVPDEDVEDAMLREEEELELGEF